MNVTIHRIFKSKLVVKLKKIREKAFSPKYLLYSNVAISISLSATGDVFEQHYEILNGNLKQWNSTRTTHSAISGMSVGILCHYWYKFLDSRLPGHSVRTVVKKVIVDQLVCSPLCITSFFLTFAVLEGATIGEFVEEVKQKAWRLYAAEWVIWPPAQVINFYYLPTKYRVLYDNTISLAYDIYTSRVKFDT